MDGELRHLIGGQRHLYLIRRSGNFDGKIWQNAKCREYGNCCRRIVIMRDFNISIWFKTQGGIEKRTVLYRLPTAGVINLSVTYVRRNGRERKYGVELKINPLTIVAVIRENFHPRSL